MSASSFFLADILTAHARRTGVKTGVPSKVRKAAKAMAVGIERRSSTKEVAAELAQVTHTHALTAAELDNFADRFLEASHFDDGSWLVDEMGDEHSAAECECAQCMTKKVMEDVSALPAYLQGALPDWMLTQLEEANGDAFASLSLFESTSPSPKARFSMEDEVPQYAD
jgi:hypothetical protein